MVGDASEAQNILFKGGGVVSWSSNKARGGDRSIFGISFFRNVLSKSKGAYH